METNGRNIEISLSRDVDVEPIYQEGSYDMTSNELENEIKNYITRRSGQNHVKILLLEDWSLTDSNIEKLPSRIELGSIDISPDYVESYMDEDIDIYDCEGEIMEEIISHLKESEDSSTKRLMDTFDNVKKMSLS